MAKKRGNAELREALESAKEQSVGQLLLRAARLWNEQAVRRLQEINPSLRMAHTLLLPHIDPEGTTLTTLAARIGISKQAVGELVDGLEDQGLLERVPDPRDRRAKLIRFTAAGQRSVLDGLEVLGQVEAAVLDTVGARRMEELAKTLRLVAASLDEAHE